MSISNQRMTPDPTQVDYPVDYEYTINKLLTWPTPGSLMPCVIMMIKGRTSQQQTFKSTYNRLKMNWLI
ncbi:MAG: hypothetical protein IPL46_16810 [Saprospiraceae bacterium]|nr:hypothetical protein [Saprospiraceae bacterium]